MNFRMIREYIADRLFLHFILTFIVYLSVSYTLHQLWSEGEVYHWKSNLINALVLTPMFMYIHRIGRDDQLTNHYYAEGQSQRIVDHFVSLGFQKSKKKGFIRLTKRYEEVTVQEKNGITKVSSKKMKSLKSIPQDIPLVEYRSHLA